MQHGEENLYVNDYGGIELQPDFRYDLYIKLGDDILTISRIESPDLSGEAASGFKRSRNMYVIRNAARIASVILDDGLVKADIPNDPGNYAHLMGFTEALEGRSMVIGRRTTPSLELSTTVNEEHLLLQVETIYRHLQITDIRSSTGTVVALHRDDVKMLLETWNRVPFYKKERDEPQRFSLKGLFEKLFPRR